MFAGAVRHSGIVPDGEDGALRVLRAALCQPQVDAALHLADGQRVAVGFDQHLVPGAMPAQEIGHLHRPPAVVIFPMRRMRSISPSSLVAMASAKTESPISPTSSSSGSACCSRVKMA